MPNICSIDNCNNNSSFILKGIGKLCKEHNQNDSKKIKNIYCYDKKCLSIGKFCNKDSENKYCNKHKSNTMLNISANKCKNINCNKEIVIPRFGVGFRPLNLSLNPFDLGAPIVMINEKSTERGEFTDKSLA